MPFLPDAPVLLAYSLACLMLFITPGPERVVGGLKSCPRTLRAIDWLFAGVFSAFALRILATQAR